MDILEQLQEHFEQGKTDKEKTDKCEEVLDYVNYYKRLTELSEDEKRDFVYCNEGFPISDGMRKTLDKCKTEKEKDYYYDMWARSAYFKLCAWLNYLGGHTKEKPTVQATQSA